MLQQQHQGAAQLPCPAELALFAQQRALLSTAPFTAASAYNALPNHLHYPTACGLQPYLWHPGTTLPPLSGYPYACRAAGAPVLGVPAAGTAAAQAQAAPSRGNDQQQLQLQREVQQQQSDMHQHASTTEVARFNPTICQLVGPADRLSQPHQLQGVCQQLQPQLTTDIKRRRSDSGAASSPSSSKQHKHCYAGGGQHGQVGGTVPALMLPEQQKQAVARQPDGQTAPQNDQSQHQQCVGQADSGQHSQQQQLDQQVSLPGHAVPRGRRSDHQRCRKTQQQLEQYWQALVGAQPQQLLLLLPPPVKSGPQRQRSQLQRRPRSEEQLQQIYAALFPRQQQRSKWQGLLEWEQREEWLEARRVIAEQQRRRDRQLQQQLQLTDGDHQQEQNVLAIKKQPKRRPQLKQQEQQQQQQVQQEPESQEHHLQLLEQSEQMPPDWGLQEHPQQSHHQQQHRAEYQQELMLMTPQQHAITGSADVKGAASQPTPSQAGTASDCSASDDGASDCSASDGDASDDDFECVLTLQPVARRLRSRHPALLQRLVVLSGDSSDPQALVLLPPPVKAACRKQRVGPQRRPKNQQQLQQHWGALLHEQTVDGEAGSERNAPCAEAQHKEQQQPVDTSVQQQQQQQQQHSQQDVQVLAGSESTESGHTGGIVLALVAPDRRLHAAAEAGGCIMPQQLETAEGALLLSPTLPHLQVDAEDSQQQQQQQQLPQLDIQQLESDRYPELVWNPERLNALLLNSSDDQKQAESIAATYAAASSAAGGVLLAQSAAATAAGTIAVEAAATDSACWQAAQQSDASGCDADASALRILGAGSGSDADAATCMTCDGQALSATSEQMAQCEQQMLPPLITIEEAADAVAREAAAAAAAAASAVGQGSALNTAASGCKLDASNTRGSHASCAGNTAADATVNKGAELSVDDSGQQEVQQQQQQAQAGEGQQQQGELVDERLPEKDAQPGDYLKVEPNTRWSPLAYEAAAAAGAAQLGVPAAVPAAHSVQHSGQAEQQLEHASSKALSGSSEATAAAGLAVTEASASAALAAGAAAKEEQLPNAACSAEFCVLMLAHGIGVTHTAAWQAWEAAHDGRVVVLVHLKAGVALSPSAAGADWLASGRQLHTRVASQWGDISLTQAVLSSAAEMLQRCPRLQHIAVVSGQDVPVAAVQLPLPPGASMIGCFQFGREYDVAARRVAAAVLQQQLGMGAGDAGAWGESLTFHHTWLILSRQLLLALLSKQQELLAVGAALQQRFMQPDAAVAADEFLLCTAAVRYGFVKEIQRRSMPTFIRADRERRRTAAQQQQQQQAVTQRAPATPASAKQQQHGNRKQQLQRQLLRTSSRRRMQPAWQQQQQQQQADVVGLVLQRSRRQPRSSSKGGCSSASGYGSEAPSSGSRGSTSSLQHGDSRRSKCSSKVIVAVGQQHNQEPFTPRRRVQQQASRTASPERAAGSSRRTAAAGQRNMRQRSSAGQPAGAESAAAAGNGKGRMPTRSGAAVAAAAARSKEDEVVGYGVLLDCCPTLALFHPTHTRHPHTWSSFTAELVCDVHADGNGGSNGTRLRLLQALGLAKPNCAWFFRKVELRREAAQGTLLQLLQLLWQDKPLPRNLPSLA